MDFSAYSVTLGGTDYPAKYAGLLAHLQSNLAAVFGDPSGNVGIGIAPTVKLHVQASSPAATPTWFSADSVVVSAASNNVFQVHGGAPGGTLAYAFSSAGTRSVAAMAFDTTSGALYWTNNAGNERMRLDQTGNVGIGTASATARLHVAKDDTVGTQIMRVQNLNGTRYSSAMEFTSAPGADWRMGKAAFSQDQDFSIGLASGTELIRLSATGNLLLGSATQIPGATARFVADYPVGDCIAVLRNSHATTPYGLKIQYTASPNNTGQQFLYCSDGTTVRFYVASNGNVYNVSGAIGAISDLKLKQNIAECTPKLADLLRVRIVNYALKTDPENKLLGVIAQELENVFPGLVESTPEFREVIKTRRVEVPAIHDEDGVLVKPASFMDESHVEREATGEATKSVKYSVFVPILIKAVQELASMVEAQAARIGKLEAKP